jgi:hypothetical protein
MTTNSASELKDHLQSFQRVWQGGYLEGDPLDPVGASKYRRLGYISQIHAVYQVCVRPYINPESVVIEIGPGRGAWTKGMLGAKEVWCLDAKSRQDNQIDGYLGDPKNLIYHQVEDFECRNLPDDKFTYLFSFGCLCHVPFWGTSAYAKNLFPKLKRGANCFWMVADYEKRNKVAREFKKYDVFGRILPRGFFLLLEFWNKHKGYRCMGPNTEETLEVSSDSQETAPGRWYHAGAANTAEMLRSFGYEVISEDIGLVPRDAILHFRKP